MMQALATLVALAVAVFGGGMVVERLLRALLAPQDFDSIVAFRSHGLRNGGRLIGWLERFLFFAFLLQAQYAAVGFVLAAKGVARYGEIKEAKDQKVAEYVLIGTMISLAWTLAVYATFSWLHGG
jgi:hypothetical protein